MALTKNDIIEQIQDPPGFPIILKPGAFASWLYRENRDAASLQDIIQNQVITMLKSVPVSSQVNSVKVNRPGNIKPVEPA